MGNPVAASAVRQRLEEFFEDALLGIVLFGSRARGEGATHSDYDYLVVVDQSVTIDRKLYRLVDNVFDDPLVSCHVVKLPMNMDNVGSLWLEVAIDGIVEYDSNLRVQSFLRSIRKQVALGRWLRKVAHGHPYWVQQVNQ